MLNSLKIRFRLNSCLALILILPLSVFASQKGQGVSVENDSTGVLLVSVLLDPPFSDDSTAVRENAQELKTLAVQRDQWLGSDKFKHFGASFVLTVSAKVLADNALNFDRDAATFSAAGFTFLSGFGKELYDDTQPNNIFSLKDLAADLAGVLAGILLVQLFLAR